MNKLDAQRQKEIQQAEELLFAGPQALGFAKGLFQGHFVADWVMPYPRIPPAQQPELDETLTDLRKFLDEHLGAFALTEKEAGSDAANVQMQARPSEDGSHFIMNGEKRYITNAAIADVLTVMARTPVPGSDKTAITAFLVTPDMPGFEMLEARTPKMGIRGTATGRFALRDVKVPKENILGKMGKGLKVALTVLDFGRTTFGACCTGAAKTCLRLATEHANTRKQFNKTLGEFDLVKKKIARIAAGAYAMEAMTTITASLIDRGLEDYMIETAMLKVFTTERLWEIINDAFQIYGGSAYFVDLPLERMLRDARINQIGEGSNEVLTSFIALVGMRWPGMEFKEIYDTMLKPTREGGIGKAWTAGMNRLGATVRIPDVPVRSAELRSFANQLGRLIWRFNFAVNRSLILYREPILDMQLVQERVAGAAMDLFASTAVLSRWDSEIQSAQRNREKPGQINSAEELFLRQSFRRIRENLAGLGDNDDKIILKAADAALGSGS